MNGKILCQLIAVFLLAAVTVQAETARKVIGQRRFNVSYTVDENLAGISSVELWYTTDNGQTWKLWGRDEDRTPPILFEAPEDGTYGFITVATDNAGNREATPAAGTKPEAVAVVDTQAPLVKIESPMGGQVFGPGTNLEVRWVASDANLGDKPVDIMLSSDGGNTWATVAQGIPNTGSTIIPLPGAAAEQYLLKVVVRDLAGNVGQALTPVPIVLDGRAPRVKLLGPKVSPISTFNVTYEAEDIGGAGLAEVDLWYTTDGGLSWNLYGKDADLTSPMEFHVERGGSYGFFLQAKDRVGNSTIAPKPGTRPELVTVIDNQGPSVELLSMNGGAFRGGDAQEIRWRAVDDNMADRPITIDYTIDGGVTWLPIAKDEPNDGSYSWTAPKANTNKAFVRVTAVDQLGNTASATSKVPFIIDSVAPKSRVTFDLTVSNVPVIMTPPETPVVAPVTMPVKPPVTTPVATPATEPSNVTAVPAVPAAPSADEELDKVEKWLSLRDDEKLAQALGVLDSILLKDPQNGRAYALRGWYYLGKKSYNEAKDDLERAASLRPQDGNVYLLLGRVYFTRSRDMSAKGRSPEDKARAVDEATLAVGCLEKALSLAPELAEEYLWSGLANANLADLRPGGQERAIAVSRLTSAIDKSKSTHDIGVAYFWRAMTEQKMGEMTKAIEDFDRATDSLGPATKEGEDAAKRATDLRKKTGGRNP